MKEQIRLLSIIVGFAIGVFGTWAYTLDNEVSNHIEHCNRENINVRNYHKAN
jgi:hypothetical protein